MVDMEALRHCLDIRPLSLIEQDKSSDIQKSEKVHQNIW